MSELVARARGLTARLADVATPPADVLAILARWDGERALAAVEIDEDRRALRALVRGIAAAIPTERRGSAAGRLRHLAGAGTLAELARGLGDHPLAPALAETRAGTIDVLAIEVALARAFAAAARPADPAARRFVEQAIDGQNVSSALVLAARGGALSPQKMFVPGGERLDEARFVIAARGPIATTRERLAAAFARTPLADAVLSPDPGAVERATAAWMLDTQRRMRRLQPHGVAAALYAVLRWRERAEQARREAWTRALGGAS